MIYIHLQSLSWVFCNNSVLCFYLDRAETNLISFRFFQMCVQMSPYVYSIDMFGVIAIQEQVCSYLCCK